MKLLFLILIAVVVAIVILWLFNTSAYYFWLAGQKIENREIYFQRLYLFGSLFLLAIALEVFIIYKALMMKH